MRRVFFFASVTADPPVIDASSRRWKSRMLPSKDDLAKHPRGVEVPIVGWTESCQKDLRAIFRVVTLDPVDVHAPGVAVGRRIAFHLVEIVERYRHFDRPVLIVRAGILAVALHVDGVLDVLEIPFAPMIDCLSVAMAEQVDLRVDGVHFVLIVGIPVTVGVDEDLHDLFQVDRIILFGVSGPGVLVLEVNTDVEVLIVPQQFERRAQGQRAAGVGLDHLPLFGELP